MSGATTPTSVYRYYDADGKLIYVGVTGKGMTRQYQHDRMADWWRFVSTQEVEHFDTRHAALRRERELIRLHRPPFNKEHNPDWPRLRAASPHAGPLECEDGELADCTAFWPTANDTWCGVVGCPICHARWHGYSAGFEDGSDNERRVMIEDLAALCAAEDQDVRTAAHALRAAMTALVETVGDGHRYDLLIGPIKAAIPTEQDILQVLDMHAEMRATGPWTEVPF